MKVKVTKAKANKVTKAIETKTVDMESWAYKTEDDLAYDLFETTRAYEDGKTDHLVPYTEDELNDMIVKAGLVANLFDKDSDTYALSLAIIKMCVCLIDVLHGHYDCLKLS